jgi:hypothetical protein
VLVDVSHVTLFDVMMFTFGLPWNINTIAMVMGKVKQGSGMEMSGHSRMASVKNSLEYTAYENTETEVEQKLPTRRVHPTGRGSTRMFLSS